MNESPVAVLLRTSTVAAAEEAMTSQPDVQAWLRQRALDAAMRMSQEADMAAGMQALADLTYEAQERYPGLQQLIQHETGGHAKLGVHFDPLNPDHSGLRIDFGKGRRFDAFRRLDELSTSAGRALFADGMQLLPGSDPFPGHAHQVRIAVLHGERLLPAVIERRMPRGHGAATTVSLHPPEYETVPDLSIENASQAVLQYFGYTPSAS
jgi:hypothetical protein